MDNNETETLTLKLMELKVEHRDLDVVIEQYIQSGQVNDLLIKRLKKRKLQLKDFIARIESRLIPDLNA
ncbi:MAG: hypothetical protein A2V58_00525 [Candidatus Muproteobacteria bacterium RBG_19FT_COMBO_61_10]|uniref:DUF465 domain-containing protein n=1 Tax=Candidatus Muproteobacteria bacterium RBG_19FT_COMBO_61_10 TaxID=1817761 RepID=A0A1F6UER4_9PROT|nr:MAG: hypothetical protein A2V58_00525 [Candidatus Muproteobacteria bacterium RBG_19FT_COMBO_61_10]